MYFDVQTFILPTMSLIWLTSLSDIGSYASLAGLIISLVGLFISIWVLINTYKLKSEFKLFVGIPRLLDKLSENASNLKKLSRKFEVAPYLIMAELSRIEANVESIKEKDKKAQVAIQQFQIAIRAYRDSPTSKSKFWDVHSEL